MVASVNIRVNAKEARLHNYAMRRRARRGFKKVFQWVLIELQLDSARRFDTGASGRWKALTKRTTNEKIAEGNNNGILVRTGRLRDSLTRGDGPDTIRTANSRHMHYGTKVPYAKYHHEGRGRNPERPLWNPISDKSALVITTGALALERVIYGGHVGQHYKFVKKSGIKGNAPIGWLKMSYGAFGKRDQKNKMSDAKKGIANIESAPQTPYGQSYKRGWDYKKNAIPGMRLLGD